MSARSGSSLAAAWSWAYHRGGPKGVVDHKVTLLGRLVLPGGTRTRPKPEFAKTQRSVGVRSVRCEVREPVAHRPADLDSPLAKAALGQLIEQLPGVVE